MAQKFNRPGRLLPFRQIAEQNIINQYALTTTGVMGLFVSVSAADLDNTDGFIYGTSPGKDYENWGIHSYRYGVNNTVRPCTSGDKADLLLGITLYNVAETDENGEKYLYYPEKAKETSTVVSGMAVPVLTKGEILITYEAYHTGDGLGAPNIGELVVPSNYDDGKVDIITRSELSSSYDSAQVIGKVIGTGAKWGGYVAILLDCGN